jgi:hypothetical protein
MSIGITPTKIVQPEVESIFKILICYIHDEGELLLNLCERLYSLTAKNDASTAKSCIETIRKYFENILKSPSNEQKRSIKIRNKIFKSKVLSVVGGSNVFLFPSFGFKVSHKNSSVVSWCEGYCRKDLDVCISWINSFIVAMKNNNDAL